MASSVIHHGVLDDPELATYVKTEAEIALNTERPFSKLCREQMALLEAEMAAARPAYTQRAGYRIRVRP